MSTDDPVEGVASTEALRARQQRARRFGTAFSMVWLFWLAWPVVDVLRGGRPVWAVTLALALTVAFVALYATGVALGYGGASERLPQLATVGLVLISVGLAPLMGEDSAAYLIFTTILTIFAWRVRISLPAVVGFVAWAAVLPLLVGGDGPPWWFFPVLVAGMALAMYAVRRMTVQGREIERAQERLAELAVADERARFARDLHDILGHSLTAIAVKAQLAGKLVERDPERARSEIADIERLAREGLDDVRRTAAGSREVTLAAELVAARTALAAAGIGAELPQAVDAVPGRWRELFGWAVREGVTNVVRHSGATRCEIRVGPDSVEVLDDGGGPAAGAGHGLRGLADRAAAAGAALDAGPRPGGGFLLCVRAATASGATPGSRAAAPRAERVP